MGLQSDRPSNPGPRHSLGAVAVGYGAVCATAAVVVSGHLAVRALVEWASGGGRVPNPLVVFIGAFGFGIVFGGLLCLPGFVLLRGLLIALPGRYWVAFAAMGAGLGGAWTAAIGPDDLALWWKYPPSPIFVIAGGCAGWAAWRAENWWIAVKKEASGI